MRDNVLGASYMGKAVMTIGINRMVEFTYHIEFFVSEECHLQFMQGPQCKPGRRRPGHNRHILDIIEPRVDQKGLLTILPKANGAPGFDQMALEPHDPCGKWH